MTYWDPELLPTDVPRLKTYTKYRCPAGIGIGNSSTWTGALSCGQGPRDHLCPCGAEYVEVVEDGHVYRVEWEMAGPYDTTWRPASKEHKDKVEALDQFRTLSVWEATGAEPVRNVRMSRSVQSWESFDPSSEMVATDDLTGLYQKCPDCRCDRICARDGKPIVDLDKLRSPSEVAATPSDQVTP